MSYHFLLDLAIILASTKVLGVITKRIQMPQVVGALIAGLLLGPAAFGVIEDVDFIRHLAEVGVVVLMFSAGLETNISEMKKCGVASLVIALAGVIVPLLGGFAIAAYFNNNGSMLQMDTTALLQNIFIGVVLTATSVSITVETLRELGKLNTRVGTAILGAALIDDVLGIIALTVITSTKDTSSDIRVVLLKILLFFVFAAIVGIPFYYVFNRYSRNQKERRRFSVIALSFCLFMAFISEHFFGVADITGAFIAGIVLSNTVHSHFIFRRVEITSYMFLAPIFFASVGLAVNIDKLNITFVVIAVLLTVVAILTKVVGCGLGALACKYSKAESLRVGIGMVSRGEVALIVANKGATVGLLPTIFFGPLIIMVIVTTVITPILLKLAFKKDKDVVYCVDQTPSTSKNT